MAIYKSVAAVIQEIEYWLRLATFLHEPLKYALLRVLHNTANDPTYVGLPDDPIQLYQELSKHRNLIAQLVKKRVLQQDQVDFLLPPNHNKTNSTKFDVTLLVVLIINFTTLQPPLNGWKDKNPPAHDRSKGAGVVRGREWRNYIHHTEPNGIDQAEFNKKWTEGVQIITNLGYHYDANKLKTISLDPKHDLVLQSLFSFMAYLQTQHDTLDNKHDALQGKHYALDAKHDILEGKHKTLDTKHDTLDAKHATLEGKHDALDAKHDILEGKHKTLDTKHDTLEGKHATLEGKHATLEGKHKTLDAKHDTLEGKHDILETKHDALISSLTQQCNKIANEVQHLQHKETKMDHINSEKSSRCLKSVLQYISKEINEDEAKELLDQLNLQPDGDLVDKLKSVPWKSIKTELEMLDRKDIVEYIQKSTLITRGLQNASDKLRDHYMIELIQCLVEQPLSSIEMDSQCASREDIYVDVVVLPSSTVDEEWSNSDRDTLMKQNHLDKSSSKKAVDEIVEAQDELIFIRGVAGIGKSTLIDMFTLKWAKKELSIHSRFDFVFKFTCRELNQIMNEFETLEQLFKLQYPKIFCNVTLEDLAEVSDRVLVIIDGLDEMKDIYQMYSVNVSLEPQAVFLKIIYDLINTKYMNSLKNHKTIVCGRPKACEFVKNQFPTSKIKTLEVCGFNHTNVQSYVLRFFDKDREKAKVVQDIIKSSHNLKFMSTVPVFLWVICNVYSEDLIKTPINTNTELYFYTCLILLRNHFQGTSNKYKNLLDIINDQVIVHVVYSLMVLSVKTYMQNQVLFTDKDIKKLKCPVHLEQTGFIVKYSRNNIKEAIYQFRHLILQEFLCGMYLCVTKGISPFLSNRELSSCLPTILGIHRIIQEKENDIFLQFYRALLAISDKQSSVFVKLAMPFRSLSYDAFIKKNARQTLTLPDSMIENHTLSITDSADCREFLDFFKETHFDVEAPSIGIAKIWVIGCKNLRNILYLLDKLEITTVQIFRIQIVDADLNESNIINEDILRLYDMTAGSEMKTTITVRDTTTYFSSNPVNYIYCSSAELRVCLYYPFTLNLFFVPDIIKVKSDTFYIGIEKTSNCHLGPAVVQDVTRYAIDHHKYIYLSCLLDQVEQLDGSSWVDPSFIPEILEKGDIDVKSKYVHIVHWYKFG